MTNYNKRLDEVVRGVVAPAWLQQAHDTTDVPAYNLHIHEAKQAITSLIKELVAEARTDELKHLVNDDGVWHQDMTRKFPQKIRLEERIKELEKFEQNLLKELEEV